MASRCAMIDHINATDWLPDDNKTYTRFATFLIRTVAQRLQKGLQSKIHRGIFCTDKPILKIENLFTGAIRINLQILCGDHDGT